MLERVFDQLIKSLDNGNWLVALILVAIALVLNLKSINEFMERKESKREDFLKDCLKIEALTGAARYFAEEELNSLLFKKVTGISANLALREKIKLLIDSSNGELQLVQFKHAQKFYKLKNGKLVIKTTIWNAIGFYLNWALSIVLSIFALVFFMLPTALKGITFLNYVVLMGFGFLIFILAIFLISETLPYSSSGRIKSIIDSLEKDESVNG